MFLFFFLKLVKLNPYCFRNAIHFTVSRGGGRAGATRAVAPVAKMFVKEGVGY